MNESKIKLKITAVDRASAVIGRINKRFKGLGRTGRLTGELFSRVGNLGGRYAAMLGGVVSGGVLTSLVRWQDRIIRLAITAGKATEEMDALKSKIYETARSGEIRVDPGQIVGAIEEIVEKTGDLEFAEKNIRNIGLAISAAGAEGKAIGGVMAEFQKGGIKNPKEVL